MVKLSKQLFWRICIIGFIPFQICIVHLLKLNPVWVEYVYTQGFYQSYFNIINSISSIFPFSIGDVLYTLLILFVLKFIIKVIRKKVKFDWNLLFRFLGLVSFIYFFFHISWGINYYKIPMHEQLEIENDYSTTELIQFTEDLIQATNAIHKTITLD